MSLPKASHEQQRIIDTVCDGNNVIVDAVAGSGKTTLILLAAITHPNLQFVQITYNSALKLEVRTKVTELKLKNVLIHSYHSLMHNFYLKGHHDHEMIEVVESNTQAFARLPVADILVIDEAQDMTEYYYNFIKKYIKDMGNEKLILMLMGDVKQCIYDMKGADVKYLNNEGNMWQREFIRLPLTMSYRLTNQMSDFINKSIIHEDIVRTCRDGPEVEVFSDDAFKLSRTVAEFLISKIMIKPEDEENPEKVYRPDDIFILAPKVRVNANSKDTPLKNLENRLVYKGIKCFASTSDEMALSDELIANKVVFSTFHQAKGRERKLVVVCSFSATYFNFYAVDSEPSECTSALYVALTRAKEKLILLEDAERFLFFIDNENRYLRNDDRLIKQYQTRMKANIVTVTQLTRFIDIPIVHKVTNIFDKITENTYVPASCKKAIPTSVHKREYVADLTGSAIVAFLSGNHNIRTFYKNVQREVLNSHYMIDRCFKELPEEMNIEYCLRLFNIADAISSGYIHRIRQIKRYNWVKPTIVSRCKNILNKYIDNLSNYETFFEEGMGATIKDKLVVGRTDCRVGDQVFEFKCTQSLDPSHKMQLCVYMYITYEIDSTSTRQFTLLNLFSGESYTLLPSMIGAVRDIVHMIT